MKPWASSKHSHNCTPHFLFVFSPVFMCDIHSSNNSSSSTSGLQCRGGMGDPSPHNNPEHIINCIRAALEKRKTKRQNSKSAAVQSSMRETLSLFNSLAATSSTRWMPWSAHSLCLEAQGQKEGTGKKKQQQLDLHS